MADDIRVMLELGPKGKKVVAVAPDWPGLERGAKTEAAAIERLLAYLPRYAEVAKLAGLDAAFLAVAAADVVERYPGVGSTDFWGISFAFSDIDRQTMLREELERELTLMRACWAFFDDVRLRCRPRCGKARAAADGIGIRSSGTRSPRSGIGRENSGRLRLRTRS